MEEFNLYKEAKDHYDLLIPDRLEGLILLNLFEKYKTDEFPEDKINDAINNVHKDLGRQSQRNEYERNNAIILKFQEFFLWRDEVKRNYRFKSYGIEFCEKIRERLLNRYSPAEIKRLFDSLYYELLRHLDSQDLNFNFWYLEHFCKRNLEISTQVEILDQQVSESVREFRRKIKNENQDLFQLLGDIENSLNEIKEHVSQLTEAFKATYEIDYKLEDLINSPRSQEFISNINEVMNFNSHIRGQLEQVSIRIDRIKPRIREFIYEFNQRDFDRKTGLFLNYLLNASKQSKDESGKKTLELPESVPMFSIFNNLELPKFIIIPDKDITPKAPVELTYRDVNKERQKELAELAKQKIFERQRIKFWIKHTYELLENESELDFTSLFFTIYSEEKKLKLSIATKVTNKLIREITRSKQYKASIIQEAQRQSQFPNLILWKMSIQKI